MLFQVAHLALVGGDSTRNCTYNVMARCMDNSFALNHYTWVGRSENKESFSALKLKCVIIGKLYLRLHNDLTRDKVVCR